MTKYSPLVYANYALYGCHMNANSLHLDEIDHRLLAALQVDASLSQRDLADRLGLSQNACWRRLGRLREAGVLHGSRAVIDPCLLYTSPSPRDRG